MSRFRSQMSVNIELEDDKNDFLQRTLNSSFTSLHSRFPMLGNSAGSRLHSHVRSLPAHSSQVDPRLRSEQVAVKLRESKAAVPFPDTRDLSFIEADRIPILQAAPLLLEQDEDTRRSEDLEDLMASASKVILVKSEIFDEEKLEHFCRAMLRRKETAKYSFLPEKGLGGPVNRRDAEFLRKWVDKMETQVLAKANVREFFDGLQAVYGQCLKELTRQVAVHCLERGALLDRILSAYIFLFEKVIQSYKKDMGKLDFDCKEKVAKLHELYLWQLDEFKRRLHEQTELNQSLKEEVENLKQAEAAFQVKERSYQDRFKKLQVEKEETVKRLWRYEKKYGAVEDADTTNVKAKQSKDWLARPLFALFRPRATDFEGDSTSYDFALVLFQHVVCRVLRFTGVPGKFITYQSHRSQTNQKHFVVPLVQVETTVVSKEEQVKRVTSALEVSMNSDQSDMDKLLRILMEAEVLMRKTHVENLPESMQSAQTTVKLMLEKSLVHAKTAQKLMNLLTTMIKQFQIEDDERNNTILMTQSKYRILERENDKLRRELDQFKAKIKQMESEMINIAEQKMTLSEIKPKIAEIKPQPKKILFRKASNLPSTLLIDRFISATSKPKCVITIKTLLKTLAGICGDYTSQMKINATVKTQDLAQFAYDWLLAKHGIKGAAEQKFTQLVAACDFFKENAKVYLFTRFLQLHEPLTGEDFRYFLSVGIALNHWGVNYDIAEIEDTYIASNECYQVLVETLSPKFPDLDPRKLKFELEAQADRMTKFRIFDFINFAIKRFRIAMSATQQCVQDLFKAADLNADGFIEEWEFCVLCRHIVKDILKVNSARVAFESSADLMVKYSENEPPKPVISWDKFAALSVEYDLFGQEAQRQFLDISDEKEIHPLFQTLLDTFSDKIEILRYRIPKDNPKFTPLHSYIDALCRRITGDAESQILYIAYKLLEAESRRVFIKYFSLRHISQPLLPAITVTIRKATFLLR